MKNNDVPTKGAAVSVTAGTMQQDQKSLRFFPDSVGSSFSPTADCVFGDSDPSYEPHRIFTGAHSDRDA